MGDIILGLFQLWLSVGQHSEACQSAPPHLFGQNVSIKSDSWLGMTNLYIYPYILAPDLEYGNKR